MDSQKPNLSELVPDPGVTQANKSRPRQLWDRIPFPIRLLITFVAVFLGSIGYLRTSLLQNNDGRDMKAAEQDQGRDEDRGAPVDGEFVDADGKSQVLAKYRGKVTVLTFWASWCGPCVVELPTFGGIYKKLNSKGLEIVAVNLDDDRAAADEFIKENWNPEKIPFRTSFDPERKMLQKFSVETIPTTFVLDKKGRVAFTSTGSMDWSDEDVVSEVEDLLEEK